MSNSVLSKLVSIPGSTGAMVSVWANKWLETKRKVKTNMHLNTLIMAGDFVKLPSY